ncbi:hypothetical protein BJ878DRAFT_214922 [Calycina marina]|uniref:Uncharacterized protein n=1 Tax=Calycina marina TaxID=1763456 RepID=A0A9P8CC92_9HELO|nr:hypothetical protein BJ878DRAFT_214922 [Calycina marina]
METWRYANRSGRRTGSATCIIDEVDRTNRWSIIDANESDRENSVNEEQQDQIFSDNDQMNATYLPSLSSTYYMVIQTPQTRNGESQIPNMYLNRETGRVHCPSDTYTNNVQLYIRAQLQKTVLCHNQKPRIGEMEPVSSLLAKLEDYSALETSIVRSMKVQMILFGIIKLKSIPSDDEFEI